MAEHLVRRGACHVFGDGISLDDGVIPARLAAQRITDPAMLTPHLFENADAGFAGRARQGDIILAGKNFARGKPRLQGLIAMAALDLCVVCASMPFKILRRAVARAIPVSVYGTEPAPMAATGDEVEVDFAAGVFRNLSRNTRSSIPPMPPILRDIVVSGGAEAALRQWLAEHPEQAQEAQN